ncbi:MAG: hypothetical protein Athens101410_611 [Parcubacteria group bacterium Athens1014_10]|nr:MAG: hypothetical protein Athens101410_611 [Parcubacteria group bacterium Athens1014_10]TSD04797.1 MAG: hypothetical protein Athens071412_581 [Parcubacteria group bacterium Athens0714_12]
MNTTFVKNELLSFVNLDNILFVTTQSIDISSDIDIYCVAKNNIKSQVHIYKKNGYWIEVFIDTWDDMRQKIKNNDEIVVGFILRMQLIEFLSNRNAFNDAVQLINDKYEIVQERKTILMYRIKVLSSKYLSATNTQTRSFFKGQLIPLFALIVFDKYGVWPESPKKWIEQLKRMKKTESRQIVQCIDSDENIDELIKISTKNFKGIHIEKDSENNKITYLG